MVVMEGWPEVVLVDVEDVERSGRVLVVVEVEAEVLVVVVLVEVVIGRGSVERGRVLLGEESCRGGWRELPRLQRSWSTTEDELLLLYGKTSAVLQARALSSLSKAIFQGGTYRSETGIATPKMLTSIGRKRLPVG